jgi:hypothetical protein
VARAARFPAGANGPSRSRFLAAVALLGGVAALFVLGVVVTVGAVLLAAVPIALILALIAYTFVRSTGRPAAD